MKANTVDQFSIKTTRKRNLKWPTPTPTKLTKVYNNSRNLHHCYLSITNLANISRARNKQVILMVMILDNVTHSAR